jgi:flagellar M-ring protein FliF
MKPGHALEPEQVAGIQRLVAASVPDIAAADVTVLDQHGVALTRTSGGDGAGDGALAQLDSKRSTEEYLYKKVSQVLDRTFGPGEAIASVDLALNLDQNKVTTDEVLPGRGTSATGTAAGVVVRERHSTRDGDAAVPGTAAGGAQAGGTSTAEADYQVGRRVEQISVASGTVKRMTVAVVVKKALSEEQRVHLREVIALAAGYNPSRGDAIVVTTLDSLMPTAGREAAPAVVPAPVPQAPPAAAGRERNTDVVWILAALIALALAFAAAAWRRRPRPQVQLRRLSEHERALLAGEVREWIGAPAPMAAERK